MPNLIPLFTGGLLAATAAAFPASASGPMDPFGDAERSVIMGGTCACHAATLLPLG